MLTKATFTGCSAPSHRDKTVMLEFFVQHTPPDGRPSWKPLTEKSARETEQRISQTLRMDYATFTNASFFLQGKADQFAQQGPSDRKKILSSILGLDAWEIYKDRAVEQRKYIETEVAGIDGRLREINAELAEGPARQKRLEEVEAGLQQQAKIRATQAAALENLHRLAAALTEQKRLVDTLERQCQLAVLERDRLSTRLDERRQEQQEYAVQLGQAEAIQSAYQEWQAARQSLEAFEEIAARFMAYQQRRAAPNLLIESERARLEEQQRGLLQQQAEVNQLFTELPSLEAEQGRVEAAADQVMGLMTRKGTLENELIDAQQRQAEAKAENPRLMQEMKELRDRIARLGEVEGAVCPLCGQPLSEVDRSGLMSQLETQGRAYADRFRANQAQLKDFENQTGAIRAEIARISGQEALLNQYQKQLAQLDQRITRIHQQVETWQSSGAIELAEITRRLESNDFALEARQELARVDDELRAIGYDPAAHEAARSHELAGRSAETALRNLETARAALAPVTREVEQLAEQLSQQEKTTASQQAAFDQAFASYTDAAARLPDLDQTEQDYLDSQEQENRLRMEVGAARQKVEVLERLRIRQAELNQQREESSRRIGQYRLLERAFSKDGVPALLIEQALPELEQQANLILDRLSGGQMTVRFDTQKDYKDKNRQDKKETLDIVISDGAGTRDYEMFSGGEAFRVNFAIRLALSRVLAQRAGARLQSLVIDEGFGSQDALGRQRLIEAINLVQDDFAKILVITHLEELKEAFPNRIEVEKTSRGSTLRVV